MLRIAFLLVLLVGLPTPAAAAHPDDARVIEQLQSEGSDLSKPHPVEFYLYFPTRSSADKAADELRKHGYTAEVRASADATHWLLLAKKAMLVSSASIGEADTLMESTAARHAGEYDGWEAPVVR